MFVIECADTVRAIEHTHSPFGMCDLVWDPNSQHVIHAHSNAANCINPPSHMADARVATEQRRNEFAKVAVKV